MNVVRPNAGCHGCGSGSSADSVSTENKNAETRSAGNLEFMVGRVDYENEPVMRNEWLPAEMLQANGYNPNFEQRTELELLEFSLLKNGMDSAAPGEPRVHHHREPVGGSKTHLVCTG